MSLKKISAVKPPSVPRKGRPVEVFPIVGIGASAGGLEALTQLLRSLPHRAGMAFVVVQHLDPSHDSALVTLLSHATGMPVSEAAHNMPVECDQVYVMPPNKGMGIAGRRLKLAPRKDREAYASIDYFFQTLAASEGASGIGVVLSGNGSDGTRGLQTLKAAGGTTFAQDEATAKYPTMPASAILARCVDFVLSPEGIAHELTRMSGHPSDAAETAPASRGNGAPASEASAFDGVLMALRQRTGVDFRHYKRPTLERRIHRRMVLHKFEKLEEYLAYMRGHGGEAKELFNDILIHVTGFFRDTHVFGMLKKKAFPRILKGKARGEPIRIWVPGCSTGEEVYSIAMALLEVVSDQSETTVQIFGTDINDIALEKARAGFYPETIEKDVSPERLRRFFLRQDGGFRINKSIREMCVFARQNVVVDPPFSNLDLISCRNVLIYLGQPLQRKIIPIFHYALKPKGLMLFGASETIGGFGELFELLDQKRKIYQKKPAQVRPTLTFAQFQPPAGEIKAMEPKRSQFSPSLPEIQRQADRVVLSHFSPAGVIIDSNLEVLQFRGRTGPFLEHASGEANLNLLKMARDGLAVDLRAAVGKSIKQDARVHQRAHVKNHGSVAEIAVDVAPFQVPPSRQEFFVVLFQTVKEIAGEEKRPSGRKAVSRHRAESEMNRLREDLAGTRESLQAIIEEQEATNEELRSANEEIMSSNEELQSTNEELETAKEELQSTNEELTTLNEELETRNGEMEHVNNDLQNVLASVNIPMVILSGDLRIRRFTLAAEKLFNLIPADIGRPVTDIAMKVRIPDLPKVVAEVIDSLATREMEVRDEEGHYWLARIRPYKTTDNKIGGAVIAMVDIDGVRAAASANAPRP